MNICDDCGGQRRYCDKHNMYHHSDSYDIECGEECTQ
jgi:hypothetical protein